MPLWWEVEVEAPEVEARPMMDRTSFDDMAKEGEGEGRGQVDVEVEIAFRRELC